MKTAISVVIPAYNEEGNIAALHAEVAQVCRRQGYEFEIIIVNDGSTDQTETIAKQLNPVVYIGFRKNFGQTAAMDAGIKQATHPYIVTIDGDGQNDPADIPKLLEHLEKQNLDVVSGWRKHRKDKFLKRFISRGANFLRKYLIHDGIHDSGCSLKIFRRECFRNLSLYGEMHRFIPALLKIKGFKVGEMVVNHRPRLHGKTKYSWSRTVKGLIDMISVWFWNKYSVRPLHLLGGIGLFLVFLSIVSGFFTLLDYFSGANMSNTALPMLTMFLFLGGIQLFISGLLADILLKSYFETTKDNPYTIQEVFKN